MLRKLAPPNTLTSFRVMTEDTIQDVLSNTPVATLPNALEDPAVLSLKPEPKIHQEGFSSFLQNKVRF